MFIPCTDKKVALFFADGCEEIEGLSVADVMYRAGIVCDKISISDSLKITSSHQITFFVDKLLSQISFDGYAILVLPGGMPGTTNLEACEPLMQAVDSFAASHRPLAAICAAPSIFAKRGILQGKRATSNPGFQHVLSEQGVQLVQDPVSVDGPFITSQGAGSALAFGIEIVRLLVGNEVAQKVAQGVVLQ